MRPHAMATKGTIVSVNLSEGKGVPKRPVARGMLVAGQGLAGDAHAAPGERQVSLLAIESIERQRAEYAARLGRSEEKGAAACTAGASPDGASAPVRREAIGGQPSAVGNDRTPAPEPAGEDTRGPRTMIAIGPGAYAENLTVRGVPLHKLPVGTRLSLPSGAVLEISRIGKECHKGCAIRQIVGDCIMPREGVFARVVLGGEVKEGDEMALSGGAAPAGKGGDAGETRRGIGKVAILTISDRSFRGEREDRTGPALCEALRSAGYEVASTEILPDERAQIESRLRELAASPTADLVLTAGGTGVAPRDVTPEATLAVIERRVPGLAEAMRAGSLRVTPHAMLSRAEAGILGRTLIVNLPGSPKGAVECFGFIAPAIPHAIELLRGGDPDSRPKS